MANEIDQNLNSIDIGYNNVYKSTWTICIFYIMSLLWFDQFASRILLPPSQLMYYVWQIVYEHRLRGHVGASNVLLIYKMQFMKSPFVTAYILLFSSLCRIIRAREGRQLPLTVLKPYPTYPNKAGLCLVTCNVTETKRNK